MPDHEPPQWLVCRQRRPDAAFRLYCFPHSGGSPAAYLHWGFDLPAVEVLGIQPPGRGGRLNEPLFTSMRALVDALIEAVTFRSPYALFGHSLGALVAYEAARSLRDAGRPEPHTLFVSAQRPPHLRHLEPIPYEAADEVLLESLQKDLGPLADELRDDPELLRSMLSTYRADLTIAATYSPARDRPLDCPLVVIGGTADSRTEVELAEWRRYTTGAFQLRMLPGDHFYLRAQRAPLLRILDTALAAHA